MSLWKIAPVVYYRVDTGPFHLMIPLFPFKSNYMDSWRELPVFSNWFWSLSIWSNV